MRCTFIKLHLHRPPRTLQLVQNYLTVQENDFDRFEKSGCGRTNVIVPAKTKMKPKLQNSLR